MLFKKRIHFVELEDLPTCPKIIRNLATDYLCFVASFLKLYRPLNQEMIQLLKKYNQEVLDLCSGGGGPWPSLYYELHDKLPSLKVTLSDLYPNIQAYSYIHSRNKNITYIENSVSAMASCPTKGVRTLFLSSHHFQPNQLQQIFISAVNDQFPIVLVETQKRDLYHFVLFTFNPLLCFILNPFIRPLQVSRWIVRLLFTYFIPAVPFIVLWDGLVSVLRTHSEEELINLATQADPNQDFDWRYIEKRNLLTKTTCFIGAPRKVL